MDNEKVISNGASVKVMRSYDYCHFEICLSSNEDQTEKSVNEMRKDAQRLADRAVGQYKKAKTFLEEKASSEYQVERLKEEVTSIKEGTPKSEWTPEQKAKVKMYENHCFHVNNYYDYEDEWDDRY